MKKYISDFKKGDVVISYFYLISKKLLQKKSGENYIRLLLKDRTGTIEGFIWEEVDAIYRKIEESSFVNVSGAIGEFNQKLKINISSIYPVSISEVDIGDFVAVSPISPEELMERIKEYIERIEDSHYKELVKRFFYSEKYENSIMKTPGAVEVHQAYIGGFLHHTYNMLKLSESIIETYGKVVNSSLLIAGIILHDIGKIKEYKIEPLIRRTTEGHLLGHIAMGYNMVDQEIKKTKEFPEQKRWKILHVILSHHGTSEFGSPVVPMIPEAYFIHLIDLMDAKAQQFIKELEENRNKDWSNYNKYLLTKVYLGSREENI